MRIISLSQCNRLSSRPGRTMSRCQYLWVMTIVAIWIGRLLYFFIRSLNLFFLQAEISPSDSSQYLTSSSLHLKTYKIRIGYPFNNKTQFPDLLCVDPKFYANKTLLMQGLLYSSRAQQFPRFSVSYCDRNKFPTKCADETELKKVTSGGRIFLFVRQQPSKNYATGKVQKDIQNFFMQYFFLVPTK